MPARPTSISLPGRQLPTSSRVLTCGVLAAVLALCLSLAPPPESAPGAIEARTASVVHRVAGAVSPPSIGAPHASGRRIAGTATSSSAVSSSAVSSSATPEEDPYAPVYIRGTGFVSIGDVIWLARCILSESNDPYEQYLVGWVVRNRVETRYRGEHTYRGVVLDPLQFSAFNKTSSKRDYYLSLKPGSRAAGWDVALEVALAVMTARESDRPFPRTTRHFYSPISMQPAFRVPSWAAGRAPITTPYTVDQDRFLFFDGAHTPKRPR